MKVQVQDDFMYYNYDPFKDYNKYSIDNMIGVLHSSTPDYLFNEITESVIIVGLQFLL